jgi:hypothetical protein
MQEQRYSVFHDEEAQEASRARRILAAARTLRACAQDLEDLGIGTVSSELFRQSGKLRTWPLAPAVDAVKIIAPR